MALPPVGLQQKRRQIKQERSAMRSCLDRFLHSAPAVHIHTPAKTAGQNCLGGADTVPAPPACADRINE
jgi:hypothetical protein